MVTVPVESCCSPVRNDDAPSKVSWNTTVLGVITSGTEPTSAELDTFSAAGAGASAAWHGTSTASSSKASSQLSASIRPPNSRHRSSERSAETSVSDARGFHSRSEPSTLAVNSNPASLKKESETSEVWPPVSPVIRCPSAVSNA